MRLGSSWSFTRRLLHNQFSLVRLTLSYEIQPCLLPIADAAMRFPKMSAVHHVAAIESHDHIAALEPGFLGDPFACTSVTIAPFTSGRRKTLPNRGETSWSGPEESTDNNDRS